MPASGTWSHIRRPQISSVVKWPETTMTPRPFARAASMCSRPSTTRWRRIGAIDPHHARANSNRPMPSAAKCARSRPARAHRARGSTVRGCVARCDGVPAVRRAATRPVRGPARVAAATAGVRATPSHRSPATSASGAVRGAGGRRRGSCACGSCRPSSCRGFYGPPSDRYPAAMRIDPIERLLRGLYSAALYVLLPITVYHLIWRGFRQREYFRRWAERYGMYGGTADEDAPRATLWVHAVSVGEVNAAAPLVNALRKQHPHLPLLVTTITPTGSARVRALWGDTVQHVYLPYDLPGAVQRFFDHFRPRAGLILETELWPNLLFGARDHGVPTYILNARLSARSLRGYRVLAPIVGRALRTVRRVGAQSADDAQRFVELGAKPEQVVDLGNLKFDTPVPEGLEAFAAQFREHAGTRPVWIAASTHDGEEEAVVDLHRRLREKHPGLLLLWAPRHPERFRAAIDHG